LNERGGRVDALVAEAEMAMAAGRFPTALDLLKRARAIDGYERAPRVMSAWWALGRRALLRRLQDVGYGWLRADGVRTRLDRMAAHRADP
jgi:hypothetical protein